MHNGFPLSPSQDLILTGQLVSGDAPIYNMAWRIEIEAEIDPDRFLDAVEQVVREHDAMRLTFRELDGHRFQQADGKTAFSDFVDVSSTDDPESEIAASIARIVEEPFDVSKCAWRSCLFHLGPRWFVWIVCHHHLVADATAGKALFRSVAAAYAGASAVKTTQYRDWVARLAEEPANARKYWSELVGTLEGRAPPYALARDRFDPASDLVTLPLGAQRVTALNGLAKTDGFRSFGAGLSRFAILATIHAAWLSRVSGDGQVCFGAPAHLRTSEEDSAAIGLFVETFPLSVEVLAEDSFRDLHRRVLSQTMTWLRYAVAGASTPESAGSFHSVLNYLPLDFGDFAGAPVDVKLLHSGAHDPGHDLQLSICEFAGSDGPIDLHFRLNRAVFGETLREAATHHWVSIADAMFDDPDRCIAHVALGGHELAGLPEVPSRTVLACFADQVAARPDAIAVEDSERSLTFLEFDKLVSAYAAGCAATGVSAGDAVVVWKARSIETLAAIWGVLRAGAVFVPFPANAPASRIRDVTRSNSIRFAITDDPDAGRNEIDLTEVVPVEAEIATTPAARTNPAYIIFTSGSTGTPKGVEVDHGGLANYAAWAAREHPGSYAFHSSIGFDLTITSIFSPLINGERIRVYPETGESDLAVLDVFRDDAVDVVKLTPAHLSLVLENTKRVERISTLVLGGEALETRLAAKASKLSADGVIIANEYGPTEAVVGAMLHRFDPDTDRAATVSIGRPADGMTIAVLDKGLNPLPVGIVGEIYISGRLARGYHRDPELTAARFVEIRGRRYYRTGDLARIEQDGSVTFLGRADDQMSVGGVRVEPAEIAAAITDLPGVVRAHVGMVRSIPDFDVDAPSCVRCSLSEQAPGGARDSEGVCQTCRRFDVYRARADIYFREPDDLRQIVRGLGARRTGKYDIVMMLSGGKDSTYALHRLHELTQEILCVTLDNGFLSDEAKRNIRNVASDLGLDHRFMTTPAMNAIFRDSLTRSSNVCQGCFKTIYTLALDVAREEGVPAIATGLSRGQFFETRLTPELFSDDSLTREDLDEMVLAARKNYHQVADAVTSHLETDFLNDTKLLDDVQFIDVFRYIDAPVAEIYRTLDAKGWKRPGDTGRSTNCRINDLGIFVHTKREGYHNYSVPYAWDVRLGVKTREEAVAELRDELASERMAELMDEIGFDPSILATDALEELVAWFEGSADPQEVRTALKGKLPPEFLPSRIMSVPEMPLSSNGKIDANRLPDPRLVQRESEHFVPPAPGTEEILARIMAEEIRVARVGATESYFEIGGDSLNAIRIALRAGERGLQISAVDIFRFQTVRAIANAIEDRQDDVDLQEDDEPLIELEIQDFSAIEQALGR